MRTQDKKTVADYPELAKQWSAKNPKSPSAYSDGSHIKAWWQCGDPDHPPWRQEIRKRTKRGHGCPYCSGRKASKNHNLAVHNPELAAQWHPEKNREFGLTSETVTPASNKKVWWQCPKRHEWMARINSRNTSDGKIKNGCPYCAGWKASPGTSLAVINPDLAAEWHPTKNEDTPFDIRPASGKKRWWKCSNGHEWEAQIASRNAGRGCSECHAQVSRLELRVYCELFGIFGEENVQLKHQIFNCEADIFLLEQNIAVELDGFYYHQHRKKQDASKNEIFEKNSILLIRVREHGLDALGTYDLFYDQKEEHLQVMIRLAEKLAYLPETGEVFREKLIGYIQEGRLVNTLLYKVKLRQIFTPPPGRSLEEQIPAITEIWDYEKNAPLTPLNVSAGSAVEVWLKCPRGIHPSDKKAIYNIRHVIDSESRGCPYCSGKKVLKEESLAVTYPEIAAQWDWKKNEKSPWDVKAGSCLKAWFTCPLCNRSVHITIGSRIKSKGFGCNNCSRQHATHRNKRRKKS